MMQHDPSVPTAYAVHNGSPSHPPPVVSPHPSVLVNSYQLQQQQQQQPAASANNAAYQTQMQMQYANQTSSPHHPQLQQHPMSLIQHPQPNGAASTAAPASRALFNPTSTGVTAVMQANINPNDPNAQGSYLLHPAYQQLQQVPSSHADLMRSHDEQQRQLQYAAQQQQQQSQHEQMMYHQQQMIQAQQQQQQRQHQQQLALARQSQTSPHMQMVPPSQQVILQTQSQPQQQTTQQLLYQQPPPIAVPPPLHIIPTSVHAPSLSILTPLASPRSSLPPLLTKRTSVGAASPKFQTRPEELYQPPQCYSPLTATTPKSMSFPGLYQSALSKASAQLLSCVSTPSTPTSTSMTTMANLYSKERYGIMYRPVDHALMHDTHIIRHAHPTYEYVPVHAEPVPPPAAAAAIPEEDEAMPQSSPMSTGFMSDLLAATNSTKKKAVAQAPVKAQPAVQPPIVKEKLKRKPEVAEPVAAEQPLQPAAKKKKVKAVAAEVKPRVNTVTATPVAVVAPSPSKGHKPIDAPAIPPSPSNASATAPTDPPASTTPVLAPSIPSPSLMASPATKERQSRTSKLAISNEVLEELAASIAQAKKKDRKAAHGTSSTPSTPLAAPAPAPASMTDSTESTALPPVKEESTPDQVENGTSSNDAKMKTEDDAMDTNTENGVETVAAAKTELSTASTETTADAVINDESGDKSEQPHVNGTAAKKASSSKKKKPQVAATTTAPSGASEDQVAPSGNSSAVGEEKESMTDEERRLAELKRAEELNEKYISKYLTLYDQSAAFANRDGRTRHQVTANASPAEALLKKKGAKREREFNPKSVIQQIKQDMKAIVQKSKQSTSSSTNNSEAGAVGTHSSASSVAANDTAATASEAKAPAPATDTAADDVASTVAGESLAPSTSSPPLTGRKRGRPPRKPQVVVTNSNEIVENHNKEVSSQPSTPALTAKPSTKPVSPVEEKGSKGESESDEDSDDDSDSDDDDTTSSSEDEEEEPRPRKRLSELDRLHLANQSVFHAEEKERKKRLKAEKKKAAAAAAAAASAAASTSVVAPGATTPTSSNKKR